MTLFIIVVILLLIVLCARMLLANTSTHIGPKGRRSTIWENLLLIIGTFLALILGRLYAERGLYDEHGTICTIAIAVMGIIVLAGGIIGMKGVLAESADKLVTETITDIRITYASGRYVYARMLKGKAGNAHRQFILKGAVDIKLANKIKESGRNSLTITYHPSSQRIESIKEFGNEQI